MFLKKNTAFIPASEHDDKQFLMIEQKLNELLQLIDQTNIDNLKLRGFEEQLNNAFEETRLKREKIEAFKVLDNQPELTRMDLLNNLDVLLSKHQLSSDFTKSQFKKNVSKRIVLVVTGIVLITLGFSMIILPAPPYFEMFTIFYFNDHDGVTVMDLISLLIILVGVYLIINNISKGKHT